MGEGESGGDDLERDDVEMEEAPDSGRCRR